MTDVELLVGAWLANGVLALAGAVSYVHLWRHAWAVCKRPEVQADEGVRRVCRRRLFRYTTRCGLKILMTAFCILRAYIISRIGESPVLPQQWADCLLFTAVLLWLTVDTVLSRRYD